MFLLLFVSRKNMWRVKGPRTLLFPLTQLYLFVPIFILNEWKAISHYERTSKFLFSRLI